MRAERPQHIKFCFRVIEKIKGLKDKVIKKNNIFAVMGLKMRYGKLRFSIIFLLSGILLWSCTEKDNRTYRQRWQEEHHMTDEQMAKGFGEENEDIEQVMGMILEAADGNWSKVKELAGASRNSDMHAYFFNLSNAMAGCMADSLMYYYQPFERGLFLYVDETSGQFRISASSEVWYRLGDMTMAEHSAMLSQIFSRNHFGIPYLKRLADINLVKQDNAAAIKYLDMLKDEGYGKWADDRMPGHQTKAVREEYAAIRALGHTSDFVHSPTDYRGILKGLINSNPSNTLARQYLLCLDIIIKDLDHFMEDYIPGVDKSRLYDEAVLIYLASHDNLNSDTAAQYRIPMETIQEFTDYSNMYAANRGAMAPMQQKYGKTYWFFFHYAQRNKK